MIFPEVLTLSQKTVLKTHHSFLELDYSFNSPFLRGFDNDLFLHRAVSPALLLLCGLIAVVMELHLAEHHMQLRV